MKKTIFALAVLLLALGLAGCGKSGEEQADLTAFYAGQAEKFGWDDTYMIELNGELLESYYPGLQALSAKQLVARMPQMTSVVNEIVLVECADEKDAAAAAEIMQNRIDDQANGGAWYPDSMEAWSNAQVYTEGNFAAMIASAEHQDELGENFTALFA
jgi:hypothetical protein